MKQKLFTRIKGEMQELRTLSEQLQQRIAQLQACLDELMPDADAVTESEAPAAGREEEAKAAVPGERMKRLAGLRSSISLNDSFRFSSGLFNGDTELMNRVLEQLSVMSSYKTAVAFLASKAELDGKKEETVDFLELLKKYFNRSA